MNNKLKSVLAVFVALFVGFGLFFGIGLGAVIAAAVALVIALLGGAIMAGHNTNDILFKLLMGVFGVAFVGVMIASAIGFLTSGGILSSLGYLGTAVVITIALAVIFWWFYDAKKAEKTKKVRTFDESGNVVFDGEDATKKASSSAQNAESADSYEKIKPLEHDHAQML